MEEESKITTRERLEFAMNVMKYYPLIEFGLTMALAKLKIEKNKEKREEEFYRHTKIKGSRREEK